MHVTLNFTVINKRIYIQHSGLVSFTATEAVN
jgi:hypothetical protein